MDIFDKIQDKDHEEVVFCSDKTSHLKAIIAIHNTTLGPSLGGARMWMYSSTHDALEDALRLSRGMTYKAAVAGLNLGGGKAVIIGNPNMNKTEALFRSFGRYVNGLGGRYITAEDVGTSVADMEYVRMETNYVTGIDRALGGSGDPSPVTAYGVYVGIKACLNELTGKDSLEGKKIAVQGAGSVASYLIGHLAKDGAKVYVTDIFKEKVKPLVEKYHAEFIEPEAIYDVDADVFSPCALGAILNDNTIPRLKTKIVAGGANNQLADEKVHGASLLERGILYAPDYVINAGGLINVANELEGYHRERALKQAERIYDTMKKIFSIAKEKNILPHQASSHLAEERLRAIGHLKVFHNGHGTMTQNVHKRETAPH
ncbi:MAG: Glu/Leu/Phe/Val dehydrogenase [Ignavibacteriales bacterium]|nr:Glu/Leu/Phe/Val dehydrogenase [Ignavibacteriales bacterium]